jgi:hypothetical protein
MQRSQISPRSVALLTAVGTILAVALLAGTGLLMAAGRTVGWTGTWTNVAVLTLYLLMAAFGFTGAVVVWRGISSAGQFWGNSALPLIFFGVLWLGQAIGRVLIMIDIGRAWWTVYFVLWLGAIIPMSVLLWRQRRAKRQAEAAAGEDDEAIADDD